jgi:3-isopropylmalate dehydratase small subunit
MNELLMPKVATDLIIPAKFLKLPNDAIPGS